MDCGGEALGQRRRPEAPNARGLTGMVQQRTLQAILARRDTFDRWNARVGKTVTIDKKLWKTVDLGSEKAWGERLKTDCSVAI